MEPIQTVEEVPINGENNEIGINNEDDSLEQQALDEILKETKRSAERAKEMGALGWTKGKIPSTNKTFLKNMLVSTLRNIDSPKQRNASGRENYYKRDSYSSRKRSYDNRGYRDYRVDDRDYKDSFYTGKHVHRSRVRGKSYDSDHNHKETEHNRERTEKKDRSRHRKEKKSKRDSSKSEKHKSKHSKSKKSKKKHKSKDKNKDAVDTNS